MGTNNMQHSVAFEDGITPEMEMNHNLITSDLMEHCFVEYEEHLALMMGRIMVGINHAINQTEGGVTKLFAQQYIIKKGLELFKEQGKEAAHKEVGQLHERACFRPIDISTLTKEEKRKCVEALMFLSKKRTGIVKGQMVYNRKPTRE